MFQRSLIQVKHSWFLLTTAAEENSVFSSLRLVQSYSAFVGSCSFLPHGPQPACPSATASGAQALCEAHLQWEVRHLEPCQGNVK